MSADDVSMGLDEAAVEMIADKVHEAWMATKREQGVTSRPSEWGEEQMAPYADLSERAKDLDRATVRSVLSAMALAGAPEVDPVQRVADGIREFAAPDSDLGWSGAPQVGELADQIAAFLYDRAALAAVPRPATQPEGTCLRCREEGFACDPGNGVATCGGEVCAACDDWVPDRPEDRRCPRPAQPEETTATEALARALLTLATVEAAVQKIERYLETNGDYLPLDAKVPMRAQTKAMRDALDSWKADR